MGPGRELVQDRELMGQCPGAPNLAPERAQRPLLGSQRGACQILSKEED